MSSLAWSIGLGQQAIEPEETVVIEQFGLTVFLFFLLSFRSHGEENLKKIPWEGEFIPV